MRISEGARSLAIAVGCFGLCATPAVSEDPTWLKFHQQVETDGVVFAEYTVIRTVGTTSPFLKRALYKDQQGVLLVIRAETAFTMNDGLPVISSTMLSVTMVDTGEEARFVMPNSGDVTLSVGTASMTVSDYEVVPASVRASAVALLNANSSQSFRDALRRFATVGKRYVPEFESLGFALCGHYFACMQTSSVDYTTDRTAVIKDFDPEIHAAGTFEQPFGPAWQE